MSRDKQYKLELSADEIRAMLDITTDKLVAFLDNIAEPTHFDIEKSKQLALH